jgi:hypothetical protein
MSQKTLPFKFEEGKKEKGVTSLGGLALYAGLAYIMGLSKSGKTRLSGLDRLSGDPVVSFVESCWRGLRGGFEYIRGR